MAVISALQVDRIRVVWAGYRGQVLSHKSSSVTARHSHYGISNVGLESNYHLILQYLPGIEPDPLNIGPSANRDAILGWKNHAPPA